jgi:hypothetical protein
MADFSRRNEVLSLMFYAVLLLISLSTIAATLTKYPIFPLDIHSLGWSNGWLLATVINYYGACLCFCGVIVSTEECWWTAILWVIGSCTIGSPALCLYAFLWLTKEGGNLRLERGSTRAAAAIARNDVASATTVTGLSHPSKRTHLADVEQGIIS